MNCSFRFIKTRQDLLDAYDAKRAGRSALRPIYRWGAVGLFSMWLAAALPAGLRLLREGSFVQPLAWLLTASAVLYKFSVESHLKRRRIRQAAPPEQPLLLEFGGSGVHIESGSSDISDRTWDEIAAIQAADKGVLIALTDGTAHWLPNRMFHDMAERQAFVGYVANMIPKDPDAEP